MPRQFSANLMKHSEPRLNITSFHFPLPLTDEAYAQPGRTPPLLRGYLRSGAWVCGAPAWDRKFQCADLFLLLPLSRLESRYARRYVKK